MAGILVESGDGILRLTMNRPDRLNALDAEMARTMAQALEDGSGVRVAVITGVGRAFCSGAELGGDRSAEPVLPVICRLIRAIVGAPFPVVTALNGLAAGVGCSMAFASDFSVARSSGYLLQAFVGVGLMPDGGATELIAASIGRTRALRLLLTGERIGAEAAVDMGLLTAIAPDDEFDRAVATLVDRLAHGPTRAYAETKRAVNAASIPFLEASLDRESTGQTMLVRTADHAEGRAAFRDKRPAVFTGR